LSGASAWQITIDFGWGRQCLAHHLGRTCCTLQGVSCCADELYVATAELDATKTRKCVFFFLLWL